MNVSIMSTAKLQRSNINFSDPTKKPLMVDYPTFFEQSARVEVKLGGFGKMFSSIISNASKLNLVNISSLKFQAKSGFKVEDCTSLGYLVEYGVKPFDFVIYKNLIDEYTTLSWTRREEEIEEITEAEVNSAVFCAYFMLITRDKIILNENEPLPKILSDIIPKEKSYNQLINLLSDNNMELMDHSWIFEIRINSLGEQLRSRLFKGIAGMRFINVLINNPRDTEAAKKYEQLILNLREKIKGGLYKEVHPRGQPINIQGLGMSKNLSNMILECFSPETITRFVKEKQLYSEPKRDNQYNDYKTWESNFFDYLTTSLL